MPVWHVYLVRTQRGTLYTGIATDVPRRYAEHVAGGPRAARYLRGNRPSALAFHTPIGNRALALRVEARLKRMTKTDKEAIVIAQPDTTALFLTLRL